MTVSTSEPAVGDTSPLLEIELRVQARAKHLATDPSTPGGEAELVRLVNEEISAWTDECKRGTQTVAIADPELTAIRAMRNLAGYGPLAPLLDDDDVWEIMINSPDQTLSLYIAKAAALDHLVAGHDPPSWRPYGRRWRDGRTVSPRQVDLPTPRPCR